MSVVQDSDTKTQMLESPIGAEQYCVTIEAVNEIVKASELTTMPDMPPAVVGMMDLRGHPTAILTPKLGFETAGETTGEQVLIFDDDSEQQSGWLVDRVSRVETLQDSFEDNKLASSIVTRDGKSTLWVDPSRVHEQLLPHRMNSA